MMVQGVVRLLGHYGKDVLAVESLRSPHPVYFRRDDDEIFYMRTGPSTRKLSPSEVVAYVSHRAP